MLCRGEGLLIVLCNFEAPAFVMITRRILKNAGIPVSSRILDFLVPCRLTGLIQDIGVSEFNSDALMKACIVGVSF
jgi:hypothetical protein